MSDRTRTIISKRAATIMRRARVQAGHTQASVAAILEMSQTNLSRIETQVALPSLENWFLFCQAFTLNPACINMFQTYEETLISLQE